MLKNFSITVIYDATQFYLTGWYILTKVILWQVLSVVQPTWLPQSPFIFLCSFSCYYCTDCSLRLNLKWRIFSVWLPTRIKLNKSNVLLIGILFFKYFSENFFLFCHQWFFKRIFDYLLMTLHCIVNELKSFSLLLLF